MALRTLFFVQFGTLIYYLTLPSAENQQVHMVQLLIFRELALPTPMTLS